MRKRSESYDRRWTIEDRKPKIRKPEVQNKRWWQQKHNWKVNGLGKESKREGVQRKLEELDEMMVM